MKPGLAPLKLEDKSWIDRYFSLDSHELSSYNFINIYIWKDWFDFFYQEIEGNLCIFAKNKLGVFLYLPPLGGHITKMVMDSCFEIMDSFNESPLVSRIENIEKKDIKIYESLKLVIIPKDKEYLYEKNSLINLGGNRFKSQRASSNYFLKHYGFSYEDFKPEDKKGCLDLYQHWSRQRQTKYPDPIFKEMITSSLSVHRAAMNNFNRLGLKAKIIKINNKIAGYTFGYPINKQTFCILFEITNLQIKGCSQYIFRRFCSDLDRYAYINVMDDSGLNNLQRHKLSYRPLREIESFIAQRDES